MQIFLVGNLAGEDCICNGFLHHQRGQHANSVDVRQNHTAAKGNGINGIAISHGKHWPYAACHAGRGHICYLL